MIELKTRVFWILFLLAVMLVSSVTGTLSNYMTESGWGINITSDSHKKQEQIQTQGEQENSLYDNINIK